MQNGRAGYVCRRAVDLRQKPAGAGGVPVRLRRTTKTTTQKNVDLTLYQWIPTHETILGFYRDAYAAINRINNVIRNIGAPIS